MKTPLTNKVFDSAMRVLRPTRKIPNFRKLNEEQLNEIADQSIFYLPRKDTLEVEIGKERKINKSYRLDSGYPMVCVPTTYGCPYRCIQCGYTEARTDLTPEQSVKVAKIALDKVISKGAKYIHLMWLSGFQDLGMPPTYMIKLFKFIKEKYEDRVIEIETEGRPDQLVNTTYLKKLKNALGNKIEMSLGIGIETFDTKLMSGILNRGISKPMVIKAIQNLKKLNIICLGHIMSHLPLLTEIESIKNAKRSILELFSLGSPPDEIILMILNIQKNTLVELFVKEGIYKIPSLWGIFKLLKEIPNEIRNHIQIGGIATGSGATPAKYLQADNKKTTAECYRAIIEYEKSSKGKNKDFTIITDLINKYDSNYKSWLEKEENIELNKKPLLNRLISASKWVTQHKLFRNNNEVIKAKDNFLPKMGYYYDGIDEYLK